MGLRDAYAAGVFKEAEDGRLFFFSWGPKRQVYEVPRRMHYDRMREEYKRWFALAPFWIIFLTTFFAALYGIAAFVAAMGFLVVLYLWAYRFWVRRQHDRIAPTEATIDRRELRQQATQAIGPTFSWLMLAVSVANLAFGLFWLIGNPAAPLGSLAYIAFWSAVAAASAHTLWRQRQVKEGAHTPASA